MVTVKQLKEHLGKFSDDDMVFAYEGEIDGLVIVDAERTVTRWYIHASECTGEEEGTCVVNET